MTLGFPERAYPVHMTPVERHNTPIILFLTLDVQPRGNYLAGAAFKEAFVAGGSEANAWSIGRYVIMPDHVHLFCSPATVPRVEIKPWSSYLKRCITQHLGPHDWNWQPDCWDTQLRCREHYSDKWAYVQMNPVRAGLVEQPEQWPWQGEMNELRW